MQIRHNFAVLLAKTISKVLILLNKGQGSALPGLVVEKIDPQILTFFAKQIPNIILVTGTNGKTTTQKALVSILKIANKKVLSNSSGSNMKRGLISGFIKRASITGKLDYDYAVLEVEEATMPRVVNELQPMQILVTNLFRDQLDAYGEIDRTKKFIKNAISISPKALVIQNADDPQLQDLLKGLENKSISFGLQGQYLFDFKYEGKMTNIKNCLRAKDIEINPEDLSTTFILPISKETEQKYIFPAPGIYNVYNALAAIISAQELKIPNSDIKKGLRLMEIAFGRGEEIILDDMKFKILLAKNPAGMDLVLQLLTLVKSPQTIFLLNDKIADGKDVSWIWDSKFELLKKINPKIIICSGSRGWDLLLRIKYVYGNLQKRSIDNYVTSSGIEIFLVEDQSDLINFLKLKGFKGNFYLIPTYTAMLAFRKLTLGKAIDE